MNVGLGVEGGGVGGAGGGGGKKATRGVKNSIQEKHVTVHSKRERENGWVAHKREADLKPPPS